MYKITGKHSIQAADQNKFRSNQKYFSGKKNIYDELRLECKWINSNENCLYTNELFIETHIQDFIKYYNKIIILDSLEDPRNIGSIIRSAAICGFGVLIRDGKGCAINETVIKCASGGIDNIPVGYLKNSSDIINKFKNNGFWIYALNENGSTNIIKQDKIILIVGSEGNGISDLLLKNSDYLYTLNSQTKFNIFNASIAASIAMYNFSF